MRGSCRERPREIILGLRSAIDRGDASPLTTWIEDAALWSCTTCAACNAVCPVGIDIYDKQGGTHLAAANGVSDTVTGVASATYHVSGLKAGTYYFQCDVHPTAMFGTFIVK